jgi:hypothetical protein
MFVQIRSVLFMLRQVSSGYVWLILVIQVRSYSGFVS